jgi:hypothetical protein
MTKIFLVLVVVAGAALLLMIVWLNFGTIDPCGVLRARLRQEAEREGGFGAVVAALPDGVVDSIIVAQYGPLSPGRCIALAFAPATPRAQSQASTRAEDHERFTARPNSVAPAEKAVLAMAPPVSYSPWVYLGEAWMQAIYKLTKDKPVLVQVLFLAPAADCTATSRAAADALTQENTPAGCRAMFCTPLYLSTCTRISVGNGGIVQIAH